MRTLLSLGTAALVDTGTGAANVPTKTQADGLYQPLDSDLTAIAALSTTTFGRSYLALADAAAARTLAGSAPLSATYITQTANSELSAEQALSSLATGYVKNTTGTGVLSVQATPIPIADGGTNAITAAAALTSLGAQTAIQEARTKESGGTVYSSMPGVEALSATTLAITANVMYYAPILVTTSITIDQLQLVVTVAGAAGKLVRMGIYNADTDWQPTSLVLDAGTVLVDTTGVKSISISQVLPPGRYITALVSDGTPTLRSLRAGARYTGYVLSTGANPYISDETFGFAFGVLPATGTKFGVPSGGSGRAKWQIIKILRFRCGAGIPKRSTRRSRSAAWRSISPAARSSSRPSAALQDTDADAVFQLTTPTEIVITNGPAGLCRSTSPAWTRARCWCRRCATAICNWSIRWQRVDDRDRHAADQGRCDQDGYLMPLLPLDIWRAEMGLNPWLFWGLADGHDRSTTPSAAGCCASTAGRAVTRPGATICAAQSSAPRKSCLVPAITASRRSMSRPSRCPGRASTTPARCATATWTRPGRRVAMLAPEFHIQAMGIEQLTSIGTAGLIFRPSTAAISKRPGRRRSPPRSPTRTRSRCTLAPHRSAERRWPDRPLAH
jgi:hypothetical protein